MTAPLTFRRSGPAERLRTWVGGPLLVLLVTGLVGFLLVSQMRGTERFRQRLQAESEPDLTRILASLSTEADDLRDEVSRLRLQLQALQTSSQQDASAAGTAEEQTRTLQVLAGTVAVTGPGLTVTIDDPRGAVGFDTLIDIVQELRDAGAEAVAVNDQRVGAASSFGERDGHVTLDSTVLVAPFRVAAIGPASTLDGGLKIPGGALDTLAALRNVSTQVERAATLQIPALAKPPVFKVAKPVGSRS
ncbi:MAG: hypothetical protein QOE35_3870 [Actinomycetota bacterium]|jgi:uncharacterized protein YlxW (UPF0749 family)